MLTEHDLLVIGYTFHQSDYKRPFWCNPRGDMSDDFNTDEDAVEDAAKNAMSIFNLHRCDNCGMLHTDSMLVEAKDLSMRLDPGGVVPSGECSGCGALCYPLELKALKQAPSEEAAAAKYIAFVKHVSMLKKWGEPDDDNYGEPFEPSDGLDDSHCCLMNLIDDARALCFSGAQKEFDTFQRTVVEFYDDGEYRGYSPADAENCDDTLLKFLLAEISEQEDCDSYDCAVDRINSSIEQLYDLRSVFENKASSSSAVLEVVEDIRRRGEQYGFTPTSDTAETLVRESAGLLDIKLDNAQMSQAISALLGTAVT